jgi:molecular chaperone DnaK (HSP70)
VNTRYIVGIDLGTSNTVVAYAEPGKSQVELFAIEQLVAPGEVAARALLPSVRFHPAPGEMKRGDLLLPWSAAIEMGGEPAIGGRLALDLGAQVPGRLVASAKSWLSHALVDRLAAILPWGADDDVAKVSPVAASASYLAHVRAAWRQRFPDAPLEDQQLILTVPASFDEGARALTLEAARQAGLPRLRLLEEPQAAFYDWLYRHRDSLTGELAKTRLLLVCDIGGGTTDLSLIAVAMDDGAPLLTRIGVGKHLMLGGDNMDLALAHHVEAQLPESAGKLSAARFAQLTARCRAAKEVLLAADAPSSVALTLLGGGARLIGGAHSVELTRDDVVRLIVDGFMPRVAFDEPLLERRSALVEFGLPYPADPAITRHLSAFLRRHCAFARQAPGSDGSDSSDNRESRDRATIPDALLLNGGVFRAPALAERLQETLANWRGAPLTLLYNDNPDLAVARGAVAYALVRQGNGVRIGGGSARSIFLILDEADRQRGDPPRGICLLPRGSEEGREIGLAEHRFSLRLGQPVRFHLASSVSETSYQPGEITPINSDDFIRLPPIASVVGANDAGSRREVSVELFSAITEVGTLELHCVSHEDPTRRWRLEFELRGAAGAGSEGGESIPAAVLAEQLPPRYGEAVACIDAIFGDRQHADEKDLRRATRGLRGQLEKLLGRRETWESPLLRAFFDLLMARARRRRRSAEHERLWLNLAGFCLRPGTGYPLDAWRIEQLLPLLAQGLVYVGESQNWSEWWTLWRRAAGGLSAEIQKKLLDDLASAQAMATPKTGGKARSRLSAAISGSHDDMIRLAASLERLPVARKVDLGDLLLDALHQGSEKALGWWALGRIGSRAALHGSAHQVVPPDVAGRWLEALLAIDWKKVDPAAFAATQIARMTGDRSRDLPDSLRQRVLARLQATNARNEWVELVSSVVELDRDDERRAFGESLPAGLRLLSGGSAARDAAPQEGGA